MSRELALWPALFLSVANFSLADDIKMHFSEENVKGTTTQIQSATPKLADHIEKAEQNSKLLNYSSKNSGKKDIYLNNGSTKVDTSNVKDMDALRNSVEFEVYQMSDTQVSYAVFESHAGICYGFKSPEGASLTDSTTFYMDKKQQDYYSSVVGANVSAKSSPQNVQYSPLFFIRDPDLSKRVQTEEKQVRPDLIKANIEKNASILRDVICH